MNGCGIATDNRASSGIVVTIVIATAALTPHVTSVTDSPTSSKTWLRERQVGCEHRHRMRLT